jgi:hypothetical protein
LYAHLKMVAWRGRVVKSNMALEGLAIFENPCKY